MSRNLPVRASQTAALQPRTISTALTYRRVVDAVAKHDIVAGGALEMEHTDSWVNGEATRINMREELVTLAEGRALAGDDPEANALVTRKTRRLEDRNDWRLEKRFG